MTSERYTSANTPGNTNHGSDSLKPDAGFDTARTDYSEVNSDLQQPDLNDSVHDDENVDVPTPDAFGNDQDTNVVDRQMGVISRLPG